MKKLLLISAVTASLSTSAMADGVTGFYFRSDLGANLFLRTKDALSQSKIKAQISPNIDLGVGYHIMNRVRGEIIFGYPFKPELQKDRGESNSIIHQADIRTLMLKGYVDLMQIRSAQIFVGAGIGLARIGEKITYNIKKLKNTPSIKANKTKNMTYSLALGSSWDIFDGVKGDIQYNFADFGKTKSAKFARSEVECGKTSYRSHNIKFGIRFGI